MIRPWKDIPDELRTRLAAGQVQRIKCRMWMEAHPEEMDTISEMDDAKNFVLMQSLVMSNQKNVMDEAIECIVFGYTLGRSEALVTNPNKVLIATKDCDCLFCESRRKAAEILGLKIEERPLETDSTEELLGLLRQMGLN